MSLNQAIYSRYALGDLKVNLGGTDAGHRRSFAGYDVKFEMGGMATPAKIFDVSEKGRSGYIISHVGKMFTVTVCDTLGGARQSAPRGAPDPGSDAPAFNALSRWRKVRIGL